MKRRMIRTQAHLVHLKLKTMIERIKRSTRVLFVSVENHQIQEKNENKLFKRKRLRKEQPKYQSTSRSGKKSCVNVIETSNC